MYKKINLTLYFLSQFWVQQENRKLLFLNIVDNHIFPSNLRIITPIKTRI